MGKDTVFSSALKMDYEEPAPEVDAEAFRQVVESRRSVRVYDGTPVPEDVMRNCLDLALLAPNSSNLQPWEFYWVRSADKRAALVEACFSQPAAKTAAEIVVVVARTKTWRDNARRMLELMQQADPPPPMAVADYYKKLVPLAYTVGPWGIFGKFKKALLFGVGLFRPVPRNISSESDLVTWAVKSTALACENLMLAFRAYGFDTCPMEGLDSVRVQKLLKLPPDAVIVMAISIGKRAADGVYGRQLRFDRSHVIFEV